MELVIVLAFAASLIAFVWLWLSIRTRFQEIFSPVPAVLSPRRPIYPPCKPGYAPPLAPTKRAMPLPTEAAPRVEPVAPPAYEVAPSPTPAETISLRRPPPRLAWLVVTSGPSIGKEFRLGEVTTVGRDAALNDVVIDDPAISRQHAKIRLEGGQFVLYDLATDNGTFVNDQRIIRSSLMDGDVIKLGETTLVFLEVKRESSSFHTTGKDIGKQSPSATTERDTSADPARRYRYSGMVRGKMPSKMYEGDSNMIMLQIIPTTIATIGVVPKSYVEVAPLSFSTSKPVPQLEVELLAAGFNIEGNKKQNKPLYRDRPTDYHWNINPLASGNFEIGFVFRAEVASGQMEEVAWFTHRITVMKYDDLTKSQVQFMAAASGVIAFILGIAEFLNKIGVLAFK